MSSTWQSRLAAINNRISQKLLDNNIRLTGLATDVLMITEELNRIQDVDQIDLNSIKTLNVIFPAMEDVPTKRFIQSDATYIAATDAKTDKEPFECYAPISELIEHGSIFLKFFDNPTGVQPWILPLRVADILATIGARTIQYQKVLLTYSDTPMNTTLLSLLQQLAARRQLLNW